MKKIYEVVIYEHDGCDEFPQLLTFDKSKAVERAEYEERRNCDKRYGVELRELNVSDTFDIVAHDDGDDEMINMLCDAYANGYNIIRG